MAGNSSVQTANLRIKSQLIPVFIKYYVKKVSLYNNYDS